MQLNVFKPVIIKNFLESVRLLSDGKQQLALGRSLAYVRLEFDFVPKLHGHSRNIALLAFRQTRSELTNS